MHCRKKKNSTRLENYTFLTPGFSMQRTNIYAGVKGQSWKGFSNMPEILQA